MINRETSSAHAVDIRRRAVDKIREKYALISKYPEVLKEVESVYYEFLLRQIELEMQNEELRKATLAIEKTRDKYMDLYNFAPVGYFTITRKALIKEVNLTGSALLGIERQKLISARFRSFVVPEDRDTWDRHLLSVVVPGVGKQICDLKLRRNDGSLFHARLESKGPNGAGETAVFHTAMSDITACKETEAERERLIDDREDALAKVKILSGLLPICASCKKIKDDNGYWNQLEIYISSHSDVLFSHGLCPACAEKAYEDFGKNKDSGIIE